MALQRSGTFGKSGGVKAAISKQLRLINLKFVKRITIKYDPFKENVSNVREFNSLILSKQAIRTNLLYAVKTDILSDRSESQILFDLSDGHKFQFNCDNLTTLEIFQQINKYITPLAPPDTSTTVETKLDKKVKKKK